MRPAGAGLVLITALAMPCLTQPRLAPPRRAKPYRVMLSHRKGDSMNRQTATL